MIERHACVIALGLLAAGCGEEVPQLDPVEQVVREPVRLEVAVSGEVRAVKATPLNVPGERFSQRRALWLLGDGEPVNAGDVVARFAPDQSELDFSQAVVDLQRNLIAKAGKHAELGGVQNKVATDLADVAVRMAIADRYADADIGVLARNEILDAIDDQEFLHVRQTVLEWQRDHAQDRGATELAFLDAQRATYERNAERSRKTLDAMELRAPHAGVMVLEPNWMGEKPRVGVTLMAGAMLASIPDIATLEALLELPQAESQGLAVGQKVSLYPLGHPSQLIETQITWISASAQPRNQENPARYITARASIPVEAARKLRLVPGQRLQGRVVLLELNEGITVANTAIMDAAVGHIVEVRDGSAFVAKHVELGVRSNARSQVLAGLEPGDAVRLIPPRAASSAPERGPQP
jgi:hypothetical protein